MFVQFRDANRPHVCGNPARDHAPGKSIYLFGFNAGKGLFAFKQPPCGQSK